MSTQPPNHSQDDDSVDPATEQAVKEWLKGFSASHPQAPSPNFDALDARVSQLVRTKLVASEAAVPELSLARIRKRVKDQIQKDKADAAADPQKRKIQRLTFNRNIAASLACIGFALFIYEHLDRAQVDEELRALEEPRRMSASSRATDPAAFGGESRAEYVVPSYRGPQLVDEPVATLQSGSFSVDDQRYLRLAGTLSPAEASTLEARLKNLGLRAARETLDGNKVRLVVLVDRRLLEGVRTLLEENGVRTETDGPFDD